MRKGLLILAVAVLAMLQTAWAYDFSATSPSGHTLYYEIISGTTNVGVVKPVASFGSYIAGNVVIPNTVTYNSVTYTVTELRPVGGFGTFDDCDSLISVIIPNSVTIIGDWAFWNCYSLTSINIPNSVTTIGNSVFKNCISLTSITIPNSVTTIGRSAFTGCTNLTSVTIPNSITTIKDGTFNICRSLTSITIPNSVTSIGGSAFNNCSSLTSITIPNSVTTIGTRAFQSCSSLTSISIPNSVDTIGTKAFSWCSNLDTLYFDAINCNDFPSGSDHPFYSTTTISIINIGDSVQRIPAYFACNLDSLLSVTIGNSVTVIGNNAFKNCIGIDVIKCKSTIPPTISDSNTWSSVPVDINLIVPCGSSPTYSTTYGWSQFTNIRDTVYTNIELSVNNELMGYTEVLLNSCDSTIIRATPNYGYVFLNWNDGNTNNPRTITLTRDTTFIANFAANTYIITATSANDSMGTVSGGGEYAFGSEVTITATAAEGYHFVSWNDGDTNNPRIITLTGDTAFVAYFALNNYTVTVISANDSMGTVSGGGEYEVGTEITITAIPNEGYHFVTWNDGNTDNPRTITVTEDATYIATFEEGVGIESRDMLSELTFYPNPTSGTITFNRTDITKIEVLDAMGKMVAVYENAYTIDISKLAKGYYAMRITTPEGVAVRKVIRK